MLKEAHYLSITLPKELSNTQVKIVRGESFNILISYIEDDSTMQNPEPPMPTHSLIWNRGEYISCNLNDIVRIVADGSYSVIHLTSKNTLVISYPLSVTAKSLPINQFMRIHRSMIININHITHLTGNSFRIGGELFTIGREYRKTIKDHFIFLGVKKG